MSQSISRILPLLLALMLVTGCSSTTQSDQEPVFEPAVALASTIAPIDTAIPTPTDTPADSSDQAYDCAAATEIPLVECQALVTFYQATDGPTWIENGNWLATESPCSWYGLTCVDGHVESLAIFFNDLQGQLPAALADLSQLRWLDLHNNNIGGPIPAELGRLANLEVLELSWNQLTGPIPAELADLPQLQRLSLTDNSLSGLIPAELGQLANLRYLELSGNQLGGPIPETLADLVALEALRLSDNQLKGTIPFGLDQLPALGEVDLSFNQLTGSAPSALFEVPLHMLWGNQLDGTISVEQDGQEVNYLGAVFAADPAVANSVWPELMPAHPPSEGPGMMWAPPEHVVFTLVSAEGPQYHNPMGLYVPAEAQIQIYPAAGLNGEVQPIVADLKQVLAGQADLTAYETTAPGMDINDPQLAMLPPSNAQQAFRSQVEYLDFAGGSGIRYLTMLSQGPVPVSNYDLFYTFQGLTDDGESYVTAYFPVSVAELPDSQQIDEVDMTTLMEDWPGYLEHTAGMLNEQPAAAFTPDLAAIDALINSLSVAGLTPPAVIEGEGIWPNDGESVVSQPVLKWLDVPGAVKYRVVVLDDEAFPPVVVVDQSVGEPMLAVDKPLTPGHYSWTVRALDQDDTVLAELNRTFLVEDDSQQ